MAQRFGRHGIFAPGIMWDPREPLPPELLPDPEEQAPVRPPHKRPRLSSPTDDDSADASRIPGGEPNHTPLPSSTVQEPNRNILPPSSISITGFVLQDAATLTHTQIFCNDGQTSIPKALYTFPLPSGCTITEFTCKIGKDRVLKGNVKPKAEALEIFNNHLRDHDTGAALLEEETPEIFTASLGNLPNKTRVTVTLTYITILKNHFSNARGLTTLTIPTYIATRYGSPPKGYKAAQTNEITEGLNLVLEIADDGQAELIQSDTHPITVTRHLGGRNALNFDDLAQVENGNRVHTATIELSTAFLDRDFVLDIIPKTRVDHSKEVAQAWHENHPSIENQQAIMLTIPPFLLGQGQRPTRGSEIIFLVDRSGSMDDKMTATKSAMQFFLKGIPEGCYFNIWSFGSDFASWCPQSVLYSEGSLQAAVSHVNREFCADMGGTRLLPAIQRIVKSSRSNLITNIIILTDGQVWYLDQTLGFIEDTKASAGDEIRFFALGIGDAVSHALVEGIAKAGGGYSEVIPAAAQGDWEDRVVGMTKAALFSDHRGPLSIQLKCCDERGNLTSLVAPNTQTTPSDIWSLNPFTNNRVFLLIESLATSQVIQSVQITASSGTLEETTIVPVRTLNEGDLVHRLAARSLLDDLKHKHAPGDSQGNTVTNEYWANRDDIRQEAEAIACKWSLVSRWTSFILLEDGQAAEHDAIQRGAIITVGKSGPGSLLRPRKIHTSPSRPPLNLRIYEAHDVSGLAGASCGVSSNQPPPTSSPRFYPRDPSLPRHVSQCASGSPYMETNAGSFNQRLLQPLMVSEPCSATPLSHRGKAIRMPMCNLDPNPYAQEHMGAREMGRAFGYDDTAENCAAAAPPVRRGTRTDMIRMLVRHQQFDGSFDFGSLENPQATYLGTQIAAVLTNISKEQPNLTWPAIFTMAVLVLLWRDYRTHQALWELMDLKGWNYLKDRHGIVGASEIVGVVRDRLEGQALLPVMVPTTGFE